MSVELHAIKYQVGPWDQFDPDPIHVELRDKDVWAITNGSCCLNREFEWEYEPAPSSRTNEFKTRTRFTLEDAKVHLAEAVKRGVVEL